MSFFFLSFLFDVLTISWNTNFIVIQNCFHHWQHNGTGTVPQKSNIHRMLIGSQFTFWPLNQWRYNQVQKLMPHRQILNISLGLCGLILFSDFQKYFFQLKSKKWTLRSLLHYFWLLTLSSTIFQMLSELHSLNFKLCSKQYNKKFVLHLMVVPQLSTGR